MTSYIFRKKHNLIIIYKRLDLTFSGRSRHFWSGRVARNLAQVDRLKCAFDFQEKIPVRSHLCRKTLIEGAMPSSDPDAIIGESNVDLWHFGADLITFEVVRLLILIL